MPDFLYLFILSGIVNRVKTISSFYLYLITNNIISFKIVNRVSLKTISANKISFKTKWVLIDATNKSLGRLASFVSQILIGKHKILFTSHINCGDNVIVINADKISIKGNNWKKRKYIKYTGYPGGQLLRSVNDQWRKNPCKIFETSVKGMLPKNKLGAKISKNLYIYTGSFHLHKAQNPIIINNEFN